VAGAPSEPAGARARRTEVERHLAEGDVAGLRALAERLEADGLAVTADELRADVRSLGAIRVRRGESSVLALPVDGPAGRRSGSDRSDRAGGSDGRLVAEVSADPDWPIQVGVAAVVVVFLVIGLLGWLISS
jgi:DNA-binding IclR family transcriptional regulator